MQSGGTFPEAFVPTPSLLNAILCRHEESPGSASTHGHLRIQEIAQQMRRVHGPVGITGKQDVLSLGEIGKMGGNFELRAAYRKAKKLEDEPNRG